MGSLALVTGGAGFIGSHLVESLLGAGQSVRVLDDFSTGLSSNLEHLTSSGLGRGAESLGTLDVVEGSLTESEAVGRAVHGCEVVYHLGALASVARSVENPLVSHAACATGTLHVLEAARRNGVRRVVYAASSSAYGGASSEQGQTEETPIKALSPYAAAKLAGELYCQAFTAVYGLETVRLRFFNIFGPRQRADSPYSGVIALFVAAMTAGKPPTVHGDGLQSRDFTYVSNAVQALRKAAVAPASVSGNVYNVGTGRSFSVLDLIAALNRLIGGNLAPVHAAPRQGDVRFSKADIARTRRDLGYDPEIGFEEGLRKTLDWYGSVRGTA